MGDRECDPCSLSCELINIIHINNEIFRLDFIWPGKAPKAGQFFMIKPKRSSVFLGRPISVALWEPAVQDQDFIRKKARGKETRYQRYLTGKFLESNTVRFLIAKRGIGTQELADMRIGEEAEMIGPLGNTWAEFLPEKTDKPIALIGGGIGIAPLIALVGELSESEVAVGIDFYAGFKTGFKNMKEEISLLGPVIGKTGEKIIATEDGKTGQKGRIPDFLDPAKYAAVYTCGPEPMLKAVIEKCKTAKVPCFVSLEKRMACGVGACLGCTVQTANGNRRCCADGPIFNANEVIFSE